MMRFSRFGLLAFLAVTVLIGANCSYYNRVIARKNLVDGAKAYKDRKFPEAEALFRYAASKDPDGSTIEGRTAQLSLARTLHSEYIGNRKDTDKAQEALAEYKKSLPLSLNELEEASAAFDKDNASDEAQRKYLAALSSVNSTTSAIASLYENLGQGDKAKEWQNEVANGAQYPVTARARALSSLSARLNSCANDITDTEATKKTVKKDGKDVFEFVKPAAPEELTKLSECVAEGTTLIDKAVALEPDTVKNAATLDIKSLSDARLALNNEIFKVFESTRSYKTSLLVQAMRLAEMEGRSEDRDRLRAEADAAKAKFAELSDVNKNIQAEIDARVAAKVEAERVDKANSNTNENK